MWGRYAVPKWNRGEKTSPFFNEMDQNLAKIAPLPGPLYPMPTPIERSTEGSTKRHHTTPNTKARLCYMGIRTTIMTSFGMERTKMEHRTHTRVFCSVPFHPVPFRLFPQRASLQSRSVPQGKARAKRGQHNKLVVTAIPQDRKRAKEQQNKTHGSRSSNK